MTTNNPHGPAVIVDPYSSGAFFAPAFTEAGVPVVAVLSSPAPPEVYASSYRPQDFSQIIVATEDLSEVVNKLRKLHPRYVLPMAVHLVLLFILVPYTMNRFLSITGIPTL